jgi:predicted chitinase
MLQPIFNTIRHSLQQRGFTNDFLIKGIIAVIYTETAFLLSAEMSYRNTSVARLRIIFGHKLANYSDDQLTTIKQNDVQFFDIIYGGMLGNSAPGDGFKYRGRGYNQITFKNNYQNIGRAINADLVNNPDALLHEPTASLATAEFFKETFSSAIANGSCKAKLGITDLAQITTPDLAVKAALQANAGFGKDLSTLFYQGVYNKAFNFYSQITFT